jgi:hypothetical protein
LLHRKMSLLALNGGSLWRSKWSGIETAADDLPASPVPPPFQAPSLSARSSKLLAAMSTGTLGAVSPVPGPFSPGRFGAQELLAEQQRARHPAPGPHVGEFCSRTHSTPAFPLPPHALSRRARTWNGLLRRSSNRRRNETRCTRMTATFVATPPLFFSLGELHGGKNASNSSSFQSGQHDFGLFGDERR